MKPTLSQQEIIKKTLRPVLKYKECYDEVYDHILSSLDELPDDADFTANLHHIIERDFGGLNNLYSLEARRINTMIKEFATEYFSWVWRCLTSLPLLAVTTAITLLCVWIRPLFAHVNHASNFYGIMAPVLIILMKKIAINKRNRLNYTQMLGYFKSNVISVGSAPIAFFPFLFYQIVDSCYLRYHHVMPNDVSIALIFVGALSIVAYYKLYTDKKQIVYQY